LQEEKRAEAKNQPLFKITKANPWFETLSQLSFGVPLQNRLLAGLRSAPLYVRLHDSQTLIVADETPMVALLRADGQFKYQTDAPHKPEPKKPDDPSQPKPPEDQPKPPDAQPPADPSQPAQDPSKTGTFFKGESYMTIKPVLKALLEKMETKPPDAADMFWFSTATEMDAARMVTKSPEFRDRLMWMPRQVWDMTYLWPA